jgi:hypothetical protein
MKNIALAIGQIEEAMGMLDAAGDDATPGVHLVLARVRGLLVRDIAASAARVPLAHYTPITAEEVERNS